MDAVTVEADPRSFGRAARALDDEADGKQWRADVASGLHEALQPGVAEVRSALLGMGTGGLDHAGEPLRQAVAVQVATDVRLTGRHAGARIRVRKRGMPRGFANAPKRLNARSWRHRVYGRDVWVTQVGQPGWFDDTLERSRPRLTRAATAALNERARRITRRI